MIFVLPMPPSINNTYAVNRNAGKPLYKKQIVREWEELAGYKILEQINKDKEYREMIPLMGKIKMGITWHYRYKRDIDAGIKVLLDLFQKQRIYRNDGQVDEIMYIKRRKDVKDPRVEVIMYEIK